MMKEGPTSSGVYSEIITPVTNNLGVVECGAFLLALVAEPPDPGVLLEGELGV